MQKSMSWGNRILLVYLSFAVFIIGMVVVCIKQDDIFLVDKEYYKEELAYQTKIDEINNANALSTPVEYEYLANTLQITYPADALPEKGTVQLFRPSNGGLDKKYAVGSTPAGLQVIPLEGLKTGLWRVKVSWTSKAKSYYSEHELIVK
jgi:hypothetical protein